MASNILRYISKTAASLRTQSSGIRIPATSFAHHSYYAEDCECDVFDGKRGRLRLSM
jgi:hypothetical protein